MCRKRVRWSREDSRGPLQRSPSPHHTLGDLYLSRHRVLLRILCKGMLCCHGVYRSGSRGPEGLQPGPDLAAGKWEIIVSSLHGRPRGRKRTGLKESLSESFQIARFSICSPVSVVTGQIPEFLSEGARPSPFSAEWS